jgi:hypothetical protein
VDSPPTQFRLLTRHFIGRFLDNDLLSPHEGLQAGLAGALALFLIPGLTLPVLLLIKYTFPYASPDLRDMASWSDKCVFVSTAMVAMAGLAALQWNTLKPDRRDYLILLPLPVEASAILWAKVTALLWLFGVFTAAIIGFGPVLFTLVRFALEPVTPLELLRWMAAHALAVLASSGFAFFGVLALHGMLLTLVTPSVFRRVSVVVQSAAIFVVAVVFLMLPLVGASVYPLKRAGGWTPFAMPPLWFVGLYQALGGRNEADWRALAAVAGLSVSVVVVVAVATHLLGFRRHVVSTLESPAGALWRPRSWRRFWGRAAAAVTGGRPARHALFAFTLRTLARSPRHRHVLAGFCGLGCAVSAVSLASSMWYRGAWHPPGAASVMSVQNILLFVLVAAVRFGTAAPSELQASWVFRLLAPRDARVWRAGLERALITCGVVPLLATLLPLNGALLGWSRAWAHAAAGFALGAALVPIMFFGFARAPFACPVTPGGGGPRARWAFYWFGFTTFAFGLSRAEAWLLDRPRGLVVLLGMAATALVVTAAIRGRRSAAVVPEFIEQADWSVQELGLSA